MGRELIKKNILKQSFYEEEKQKKDGINLSLSMIENYLDKPNEKMPVKNPCWVSGEVSHDLRMTARGTSHNRMSKDERIVMVG
jgi:hypothetical protein